VLGLKYVINPGLKLQTIKAACEVQDIMYRNCILKPRTGNYEFSFILIIRKNGGNRFLVTFLQHKSIVV
jgi:hypothetical protein